MKIGIGSLNPTKINSVKNIFLLSDVIPLETDSGVSKQPITNDEAILGAINRAKHCLTLKPGIEIAIGLEGGVNKNEFGLFLTNWGALVTKSGVQIIAGGSQIMLPSNYYDNLKNGYELKDLLIKNYKIEEINKKQGAIGLFTNNAQTREEMFTEVVRLLKGQFEFNQLYEGAEDEKIL